MNKKFILVIAGEPYSVFLEIFFKSIKNKNINSKIVLIVSKKILLAQMKVLNYKFKINQLNINDLNFIKKFDDKKINIINVEFEGKKTFDKISDISKNYLDKSFNLAIKLVNKGLSNKVINGPISKKHFLKEKFPGITEYMAHKTKSKKFAMLIYNKSLSVSPITTHIPLKNVHKEISKKKNYR